MLRPFVCPTAMRQDAAPQVVVLSSKSRRPSLRGLMHDFGVMTDNAALVDALAKDAVRRLEEKGNFRHLIGEVCARVIDEHPAFDDLGNNSAYQTPTEAQTHAQKYGLHSGCTRDIGNGAAVETMRIYHVLHAYLTPAEVPLAA